VAHLYKLIHSVLSFRSTTVNFMQQFAENPAEKEVGKTVEMFIAE